VHCSLFVTHLAAQASFCASSPDASPATLAPERYFPAPGSSFGSPLWPAIDAGLTPWQPCDTAAWHNGAGGHDYGNLKGTTHDNADICTLRFAFIGRPQLCPRSLKKPHPDQENHPPNNLKNPTNNTQEEECCPQAFEEDLRSTKRDFQTG
jgi:hypothetical protein